MPKRGLGQNRPAARVQRLDAERGQRHQQKHRGRGDDCEIHGAHGRGVGEASGAAGVPGAQRKRRAAGEEQQRAQQTQRDLNQRKRHRFLQIKIKAQRLVDRDFQRRRLRAAAEREHDGERGEAQQKNHAENAGNHRAQQRPFNMKKNMARPHSMQRGEAARALRQREQAVQKNSRGQRQIKKHMREQNAGQAIEIIAPRDAGRGERVVDPAAAPVHRDQADDRDHARNDQRHAAEFDQRAAPEKPPPRQRARERQRERGGKQRRQRGLQRGEADDRARQRLVPFGKELRRAGLKRQSAERACHQRQREQRDRQTRTLVSAATRG